MITIAIILTLATIVYKLRNNYSRWKQEDYTINHRKEWLLLAAANIPSIVLLTISAGVWYAVVPAALMIAFFIWLVFDGLYNLLRNYGWWYLGTDDPDDAKTDNFLQRLKLWQHIAAKLGGLVLFTVIYILCN